MPTSTTIAGGSSNKRRRTDDDDGSAERPSPSSPSSPSSLLSHTPPKSTNPLTPVGPPPIRSSTIWFDDGSIVLQAENIQFRVHRTMLSRHSDIFKDMFEIAVPSIQVHHKGSGRNTGFADSDDGSGEVVDGCPVVRLPMDSAEDVGNILSAIYDKRYNPREPIPFPLASAMIRLGRKYELDQLRNEAVVRLTSEFPTTLAEWEKLPPYYTHFVQTQGLLFDIVNLALECDIRSILPSAYYLCVQDLNELLSGLTRPDGTIARLPPDVQRTCIIARERLLLSQSENTFAWVEALCDPNSLASDSDCLQPSKCSKVGNALIKEIWMPMPEVSRTLEKWADFVVCNPQVKDLCQVCAEDAQVYHEAGRRRVWDLLPQYFGLGEEWGQLKNFEA